MRPGLCRAQASFLGQDPWEMAFTELCGWFDGFLKERHVRTGNDEKGHHFSGRKHI